eukprot:3501107-Alexandrium_andersonii.AAC.1
MQRREGLTACTSMSSIASSRRVARWPPQPLQSPSRSAALATPCPLAPSWNVDLAFHVVAALAVDIPPHVLQRLAARRHATAVVAPARVVCFASTHSVAALPSALPCPRPIAAAGTERGQALAEQRAGGGLVDLVAELLALGSGQGLLPSHHAWPSAGAKRRLALEAGRAEQG